MSGGVPAGELREHIAQIVARAYGGSLYPGLGTPGDYPTADADYRAADAILALPTPTPPIEGRDADVERLREALLSIEIYGTDTLSGNAVGLSDREWMRDGVREMRNRARAALQALGERG